MKYESIMETLQNMARHKDGTYVSMDLTAESREMLDRYVEQMLGLSERVDPSTYHITVIYSRTPVPTAEDSAGLTTDTPATVHSYEVFPTKNDGKCLVMRLDFPYASTLNAELTRQGATSDYDEYKPHLTLAYDMEQDIDPATLPVPQFPLYFDAVKVAPLQPDYVPANK
jgi:2'-5' RNA ligase